MKPAILAAASIFLLCNVNAQAPAWGQCGGIHWTGTLTCQPDQVCTYQNQEYSQCLPITTSTTTIDTLPTSPPGVPADW